MILRTLLSIVYLAVVAAALVVELIYPGIASFLLYGLLAWFLATLFLYRLPVMSRPIGTRAAASPAAPGFSAPPSPLPSGPSSPPSLGNLGFCPYCASPLEAGTPVCPACGHRIPV